MPNVSHKDLTGAELHIAKSNVSTGTPVGSQNAGAIGELYYDSTLNRLHIAEATGTANWIDLIGESDTYLELSDTPSSYSGQGGLAVQVNTGATALEFGQNLTTTGSPTFTTVTIGASVPFSDSSGTLTLQNVDVLDATTESTIETAIDTLANLTSIQGKTITLEGNTVLDQDYSVDAFVKFGKITLQPVSGDTLVNLNNTAGAEKLRLRFNSTTSKAEIVSAVEMDITAATGDLNINTTVAGIDIFAKTTLSVSTDSGNLAFSSSTGDISFNTNDLYIDTSTKFVGLGISLPTSKLHVVGDAFITGAFKDSSGDAGTSGQILSSTVTGTNWITDTGGNVTKVGTPVNNQVGVWTGDGTIEGTIGFIFDSGLNTLFLRSLAAGTASLNFNNSSNVSKFSISYNNASDFSRIVSTPNLNIESSADIQLITGQNPNKVNINGGALVIHDSPNRVVVGTTNLPDASAILSVVSISGGFLPPVLTTTQRDAITTPLAGIQIYNSTTNKPNFRNASAWVEFGGDVFKVGTPVDNQLGVWTGDGTLEGDTALTFNTSTDVLNVNGQIVSTKVGGGLDAGFHAHSNTPAYSFREMDASVDNKLWHIAVQGEQFRMEAINDADSVFTMFMTVDRTGTVIDAVNFPNGPVNITNNLTVGGNLTVNGTTTTLDTTTLLVEDKNIELGVVTSPTDVTADGGGITLKGTTDKTISWVNATDSWTFNQKVFVQGDVDIETIDNTPASVLLINSGTNQISQIVYQFNSINEWAVRASSATVPSEMQFVDLVGSLTPFRVVTGAPTNSLVVNSVGVGINKATPAFDLDVVGNMQLTGSFRDSSGDVGTSGQILSSTVTGTNWITSSAGDVTKVGTPVNNQVGVWTGDGTLEGDVNLIFDSATDFLGVGVTPDTALTVRSTAANTTPIARFEVFGVSGADYRLFASNVPPNGVITGNPGDHCNIPNGVISTFHIHRGVTTSNSDWVPVVTAVLTPVDNQIGVWSVSSTLEGTSSLTFDGNTFLLSGAANDTTAVVTRSNTGINNGTTQTFIGDRDPNTFITGAGGAEYIRDSGLTSKRYLSREATTGTTWDEFSTNPPNVKEIKTLDDFDDLASGGIVTFATSTTLILKATISTANRIVVNSGITLHIAANSITGGTLNYTGTATFITTVGGTVRIIDNGVVASSGGTATFLSQSGGGTFTLQDAALSGWNILGNYSDGLFVNRFSNFINCLGGWTITNPSIVVGFSAASFNIGTVLTGAFYTINTNNSAAIISFTEIASIGLETNSAVFDFSTEINNSIEIPVLRCSAVTGGTVFKQSTVSNATINSVVDSSPATGTITAFADDVTGISTTASSTTTYFNNEELTISGTTSYNGTFQIFGVVAGVSFKIRRAFVANDATGSIASVRIDLTLATGHGITAGNDLKVIKSNFYNGFVPALNVATNVLTVNGTFILTDIGEIERNLSLDETDRRIDASNNPGLQHSKRLAFGKVNGNTTSTTPQNGAAGGVYVAINCATIDDKDVTQRFRLINATNGIYRYIGTGPFNGEISAILNFNKVSGSSQNYRMAFSINSNPLLFNAIASTAITGVTNSSGTASFTHAGTTPPVGTLATLTGFTTNTVYNIIEGLVTASTATTFEISGIAFGTSETGNYTVAQTGYQPAEAITTIKSQTMKQVGTLQPQDTFQVMFIGDGTTNPLVFSDVSISAEG